MSNAVSACKQGYLFDALCITSCYPAGIELFSKKRSDTLDTLTLKIGRSLKSV
jgi:hypothetical protein